jgi:6-pyruvoyltetrahydropterin/6-carboxytetrahydropterin synthase
MYRLAISRDFIAQHYLIGGDWGDENKLHSHHYRVEAHIEGTELNEHGYLMAVIARFRDRSLNDQAEFGDANPSLERFARILHEDLNRNMPLGEAKLSVTLWENDTDFAGYSS